VKARLRSVLIAGAADLERAAAAGADGLLLDLADEHRDLGSSRQGLRIALRAHGATSPALLVRVNHPRTRLLRDDLEAVVAPGLAAVVVPHVTEPQDVRDVAVLLREFELAGGLEPGAVAVLPTIDTARGMLRAHEIASCTSRAAGLVFDSHRYAHDAGARHEEWGPRLSYARGAIVAAARSAGGRPFVIGEGTECRQLAHYGFAGIFLATPASVGLANAAFQPNAAARLRAERIVAAYDAARAEGAWVARLDGWVVDGHAAARARQLLDEA
jgi:citrate lyase subunit beta/citryl-CoA lyase